MSYQGNIGGVMFDSFKTPSKLLNNYFRFMIALYVFECHESVDTFNRFAIRHVVKRIHYKLTTSRITTLLIFIDKRHSKLNMLFIYINIVDVFVMKKVTTYHMQELN